MFHVNFWLVSDFSYLTDVISFLIIPIFLLKQIYEFPSRDPRVATAVSFAVMNEFRGRVYYSQSGDEQLEVLHQIPFHTTFSAVVKTWSKNSRSSIRLYKVSSKSGLLEGLDELRFLCARSLSELNNVKNDIVHLGKEAGKVVKEVVHKVTKKVDSCSTEPMIVNNEGMTQSRRLITRSLGRPWRWWRIR